MTSTVAIVLVMPNRDVVNFRQSSIKDMLMCPLRYKFGQIDGMRRQQTSAMFGGTAFHAMVEAALRDKQAGQQRTVDAYFEEGWAVAKARADAEGGVRWDASEAKTAEQMYVAFEDCYANVVPTVRPVVLELKFQGLHVPGLDVTLEGTIDCIEKDDAGNYRARDWKTSSRAWVASDVEKDVQASMYTLAFFLMTGIWLQEFRFDVWVRGNTARHEPYPTQRSPEQIERFKWMLDQWANFVRSGQYYPHTNGWWCSERWCAFWDACPAGGATPKGNVVLVNPITTPSTPVEVAAPTRKTGGGVTPLSTAAADSHDSGLGDRGAVTPPAASTKPKRKSSAKSGAGTPAAPRLPRPAPGYRTPEKTSVAQS